MNTSFYTSVIILACFCSLIMVVAVLGNVTLPREKRNLFMSIFVGVVAGGLFEWAAKMLDGMGGIASYAIVLLKLCEFSLSPALAVLYAAVFNESMFDEHLMRAYRLLGLHAIIEVLAVPIGLIFFVDAAGVYRHGPAYALYIIAYIASALFLLVETKRCSISFQTRNRSIPWLILTFVLAGTAIQMVGDGARVVWVSMAMAGVLFYLFYCSIIQQSDSVTHLFNRYSYESAMQILAKPAVVLFIDVDDFKSVNDSYGHAIGDQVLTIIGRAIFETYGKAGSCYRIGGDEFSAIVFGDAEQAKKLDDELERRLAEARAEMPILPTVSIGGALFDPATSDVEDVKRRADAKMYEVKRAKKVGR